jgi:threonine aldolase
VETNIVFFTVDDAPGLCAALERDGVRMGAVGRNRVRAVTHLDVDAAGIDLALETIRAIVVRATT